MKIVHTIDRQNWSKFVYNHPNGNIFQTPEMYEVYKRTKNYEPVFLAVVNDSSEVLGILISVIQREYSGFLGGLTTRSIIWGGPLVINDNAQVLGLLLREYDNVVGERALYSQFRNLWDVRKSSVIFNDFGYCLEDRLNIIIDLSKSEELLWKEVHPKRRNEIRKATKEGILVYELNTQKEIAELHEILSEVYKTAELPIADRSLFVGAFEILSSKDMIKYFGAFDREELIGVICILAYREVLYDWYAGSLRKYYCKCPNDLLPWEVFRWGKKNGYKVFDFGGAGKPGEKYGVRDYKKKFGGDIVHYARFEKIHQPIKSQIAKAGFRLWQKIRR